MSLRTASVGAVIPVADLDRARQFYEGGLGLAGEAVRAATRSGATTGP